MIEHTLCASATPLQQCFSATASLALEVGEERLHEEAEQGPLTPPRVGARGRRTATTLLRSRSRGKGRWIARIGRRESIRWGRGDSRIVGVSIHARLKGEVPVGLHQELQAAHPDLVVRVVGPVLVSEEVPRAQVGVLVAAVGVPRVHVRVRGSLSELVGKHADEGVEGGVAIR